MTAKPNSQAHIVAREQDKPLKDLFNMPGDQMLLPKGGHVSAHTPPNNTQIIAQETAASLYKRPTEMFIIFNGGWLSGGRCHSLLDIWRIPYPTRRRTWE